MPVHYNSASRLLQHFEALLTYPNGMAATEAWGKIFDINEPDGDKKVFKVAERLCVLNDELMRMEAEVVAAGSFGADLYAVPIQFARLSASPAMLVGGIDQSKNYIEQQVKIPFRYMVPGIPTEEREFVAEDLAELNKLIAQLQETVESSALAPHILQLVKNHIALLLRGIALYPIQGPLALRQALKHMAAELFENRGAIQEHGDTAEIGLLGTIWLKAQAMTKAAGAASDYITVGTLAFEAGKLITALGGG